MRPSQTQNQYHCSTVSLDAQFPSFCLPILPKQYDFKLTLGCRLYNTERIAVGNHISPKMTLVTHHLSFHRPWNTLKPVIPPIQCLFTFTPCILMFFWRCMSYLCAENSILLTSQFFCQSLQLPPQTSWSHGQVKLIVYKQKKTSLILTYSFLSYMNFYLSHRVLRLRITVDDFVHPREQCKQLWFHSYIQFAVYLSPPCFRRERCQRMLLHAYACRARQNRSGREHLKPLARLCGASVGGTWCPPINTFGYHM